MRIVSVNFEPFEGAGSTTQYACIGANSVFLISAFVSLFASTLDDPWANFDSQPKWMFMSFCSGVVVSPIQSLFGNR